MSARTDGTENRGRSRKRTPSRRRARSRQIGTPPLVLSMAVFLVTVILLLVIVSGRGGGLLWDGWGNWGDRFSLLRRDRVSGSVTVFEGVRELNQLETLSYVQRTVFPHDFLQPHLTETHLLRRIRDAGTTAAEALSAEELAHLRAVNLAESLGLATTRDQDRFVVVTTILVFGYELETVASELEQGVGSVFTIPVPQLLSVVTENVNRDRYPFPAIFLDAEGWRQVTTFVEDHVTATAPTGELRRAAAVNGLSVLTALLATQEHPPKVELPEEDVFFHGNP